MICIHLEVMNCRPPRHDFFLLSDAHFKHSILEFNLLFPRASLIHNVLFCNAISKCRSRSIILNYFFNWVFLCPDSSIKISKLKESVKHYIFCWLKCPIEKLKRFNPKYSYPFTCHFRRLLC